MCSLATTYALYLVKTTFKSEIHSAQELDTDGKLTPTECENF